MTKNTKKNISKYNKKNNTLNSNLNQRKHLLNIIIFMICFTVIYYQITLLYQQIVVEVNADPSEQQSNSKNNLYCAVAIDAGSTGTRILAVAFEKIQFIKKKTLLQRIFCYKGFTKEYNYIFQKEEGGLSQYAYNEMKREQIIRALLKQAENFMNTNQKCGITPLLLRATAGLRLLNDKSDEIINQVKRIFSEYSNKFKVDENSVAIMNGDDEGYYAWFTINYLFDNQMSFKNTVAVFDLGGGSLQITFYLPNSEKNITIDPKYIKLYTVMGEERKFYTYSYLGFGLMEVRTKIFKPKDNDILNVTSPCHNTNDVLTYTFSSKIYYITGSLSDGIEENYKTCQKAIKSIVEKTVGNLKNMTSLKYVMAISFFYDLGLDAKLIPTNGGHILIKKLDEAALNCFHNKFDKDQPFKYFDLTYIYVLLHHGFGFSPDSIIAFEKSISNFELSWVLGFAYVHLRNLSSDVQQSSIGEK